MKCYNCGGEMQSKNGNYNYRECGLDNVVLMNIPIHTCTKCGEREVSIPCLPDLHRYLANSIITQKQPLRGQEVRFLRKHAGCSSKRFAEIIAVANSTLSRWENENQSISPSHDRLIRMVYCAIMEIPASEVKSIVEDDFAEISNGNMDVPLLNLAIDAWKKKTDGCNCSQ